ncbi:hypothetical protein D9M70_429190 [compost metagenome]
MRGDEGRLVHASGDGCRRLVSAVADARAELPGDECRDNALLRPGGGHSRHGLRGLATRVHATDAAAVVVVLGYEHGGRAYVGFRGHRSQRLVAAARAALTGATAATDQRRDDDRVLVFLAGGDGVMRIFDRTVRAALLGISQDRGNKSVPVFRRDDANRLLSAGRAVLATCTRSIEC